MIQRKMFKKCEKWLNFTFFAVLTFPSILLTKMFKVVAFFVEVPRSIDEKY